MGYEWGSRIKISGRAFFSRVLSIIYNVPFASRVAPMSTIPAEISSLTCA